MIQLHRTDSNHKDFIALVKQLDTDLAKRDGEDHAFYAQFNKIDLIKYVIIAYKNKQAVGCGAIKEYETFTVEVKRMYTLPASRGMGIAGKVLNELENWAAELNYSRCILETGIRQPEAIALYRKSGYCSIPNYGQYAEVTDSRCFEKILNPS